VEHVPQKETDMSGYKEGQVHQLMDKMEKLGFTCDDLTSLGQNWDEVLTNLKLVLLGLAKIVPENIKLACDKPFNPAKFIGEYWAVWKDSSADGDGLEGKECRDTREDNLSIIDWNEVIFETHLHRGETSVLGEDKLKRAANSNNISLGGKAFLSLWEDYQDNAKNSVLEELHRNKGMMCIYFFGLCLRCPDGTRNVLYLRFHSSDIAYGWVWHYDRLSNYYNYGHLSASILRS